MKNVSLYFLIGIAVATFGLSATAQVRQLTFGEFDTKIGTCELNELGFVSDQKAKRYKGKIQQGESGARAHTCTVVIPLATFAERYQYCALASIEVSQPVGYVCEVFHFADSVSFSYSHSGTVTELPMCSFVCPSK